MRRLLSQIIAILPFIFTVTSEQSPSAIFSSCSYIHLAIQYNTIYLIFCDAIFDIYPYKDERLIKFTEREPDTNKNCQNI